MNGIRPAQKQQTEAADPRLRRALRRARWNTAYVRTLRVALPVIAVGLAGAYGFVLNQNLSTSGSASSEMAGLSFDGPTISAEGLGMSNPRYEGFDNDGSRYVVSARKAISDFRSEGSIKLETINGELTTRDTRVTRLEATRGLYTRETGQLKLADGIVINTSDGMVARLVTADVDSKAGLIRSREPVEVEMPSGTVVGRTLDIDQRARTVSFGDGVVATLTPQAQPGNPATAQTASPGNLGLALDNGAPVRLTSRRLDIDDTANRAVFVTDVEALQAGSSLSARQLEITYEAGGTASDATDSPDATTALGGAGANRAIKAVTASGNVVLKQGDEQVTADRADFDPKAQTALLQGSVRVTSPRGTANAQRMQVDQTTGQVILDGDVLVRQESNSFSGQKLELDQQRGWLRLTSPASGRRAAGRIQTRFQPTVAPRAGQSRASSASTSGAQRAPFSFQTDTNAPIEVAASRLEVDDRKKVAVYRGDVRAAQGPFNIRSRTLTATYTGSTTTMMAAGSQVTPAPAGAPADLRKLTASGDVMIASASQRARGDTAVFDVPGNALELRGNVTLIDGRQVLKGDVLLVDMTTGISRLKAGGATAATKPENGRMRAVFYPVDMMNARRSGESRGQAQKPAPQAPNGWSATTAPNTN